MLILDHFKRSQTVAGGLNNLCLIFNMSLYEAVSLTLDL